MTKKPRNISTNLAYHSNNINQTHDGHVMKKKVLKLMQKNQE